MNVPEIKMNNGNGSFYDMTSDTKKEPTLKVDSDKIVTGIMAKDLAIHHLEYQALTANW